MKINLKIQLRNENNMHKTIVVNIFGGPSAGKSTTSAGIFYELKRQGIRCELVTEYAKSKVW